MRCNLKKDTWGRKIVDFFWISAIKLDHQEIVMIMMFFSNSSKIMVQFHTRHLQCQYFPLSASLLLQWQYYHLLVTEFLSHSSLHKQTGKLFSKWSCRQTLMQVLSHYVQPITLPVQIIQMWMSHVIPALPPNKRHLNSQGLCIEVYLLLRLDSFNQSI